MYVRLIINVPVVYMGWDEMILMGLHPFRGPTPSNGPSTVMDVAHFKIIKSKLHIKNRYISTVQPFVQSNTEINSDMKSALDRPPVHKIHNTTKQQGPSWPVQPKGYLNFVAFFRIRIWTRTIRIQIDYIRWKVRLRFALQKPNINNRKQKDKKTK